MQRQSTQLKLFLREPGIASVAQRLIPSNADEIRWHQNQSASKASRIKHASNHYAKLFAPVDPQPDTRLHPAFDADRCHNRPNNLRVKTRATRLLKQVAGRSHAKTEQTCSC